MTTVKDRDMLARSPIRHANRIRNPLLISHKTDDSHVTKNELGAIVAKMAAKGPDRHFRVAEEAIPVAVEIGFGVIGETFAQRREVEDATLAAPQVKTSDVNVSPTNVAYPP